MDHQDLVLALVSLTGNGLQLFVGAYYYDNKIGSVYKYDLSSKNANPSEQLNGDNVNDYFIIPCLSSSSFPNSSVSVFNQWGDEVFKSIRYENNWDGRYNGEALPVGTYFFVVDFGDGQKPQSGFVQLER